MAYTTIDKPSDYFNTLLYTANNTGGTSITGVGFQPDLIWFKNRTSAYGHRWCDSVRGANKLLSSNSNSAEATPTDSVRSIDSDGFTLGVDNEGYGVNYPNGNSIVSWNWKAGGSASSNSDGSITSSVSVSTDAGFSIVSYTGNGTAGATVGHGLGAVPQVLILKGRDQVENWTVYHEGLTSNNYALRLNDTAAQFSQTLSWNNTTPTSSVFTLGGGAGTSDYTNRSGINMIAYCFAEKKGYSKFGSYTGNGNADGTYIHLGFRPAWVLQKNIDATQGWQLQDNKRLGYNPDNYLLQPHTSQAESALQRVDLLSNGFKVRTTDAGQNSYGTTYIYMAFAENPFVNSNGVPNNAR